MTRRNAITAVTGQIFEEGWTGKGKGRARPDRRVSVNMNRSRNMARAAQGHRAAFFKMVRGGGTKTAGQLADQFTYLFGRDEKCVEVHDSRGTYDGAKTMTPEQIEAAADRWASDWRGFTQAGHTTHMVMSFPHGSRVSHVSQIAREICDEMLGGRFDYMIAVHADRQHPHAHIVVNRRNAHGELFYLKRGTEFSYETFRQAMVDHARHYGIQLEATGRLQRGLATRGPTTGQWQQQKKVAEAKGDTFQAPPGRERIGADLDRALRRIDHYSHVYRGIAAAATRDNFHDLATACERAAELLQAGEAIPTEGDAYMHTEEDFDRKYTEMRDKMALVEARIAAAAPNERPGIEARRDAIYASISHMQPKGTRSAELNEPASDTGVYSAANRAAAVSQLNMAGRDKLDRALDGTGIDPVEVENRMRVGAQSLSTERDWIAADLRAVAEARGLDLRSEQDMNKALDTLDETYDRLAKDYGIDDAISRREAGDVEARLDAKVALEIAELRRQGYDRAAISERSHDIEDKARAEIEAADRNGMTDAEYRAAVRAEHKSVDPTMDQLSRRDETSEYNAANRQAREDTAALDEAIKARDATWEDALRDEADHRGQQAEAAFEREQGGQGRSPQTDDFSVWRDREAISDLSQHPILGGTSSGADLADRDRRADQAAEERRPAVTGTGMTDQARAELRAHAHPVGAEDERRLKEAVERNLSHDDLDKLRRGDARGLAGVGTREDQLEMARDYLRATKDASQSAVERVNEQLAAERAQTRRGHDQGVDHG